MPNVNHKAIQNRYETAKGISKLLNEHSIDHQQKVTGNEFHIYIYVTKLSTTAVTITIVNGGEIKLSYNENYREQAESPLTKTLEKIKNTYQEA